MINPLIGIHAALGELGSILFLWVAIELFNPTDKRIKRAKFVALLGFIFLFLSWIIGGYYYVKFYGLDVKPLIKESSASWAHLIVMETKEHVFLLLPVLSILTYFMIKNSKNELLKNNKLKNSVVTLSILIFLIGMSMAFMGYLISSAARLALEVKVL